MNRTKKFSVGGIFKGNFDMFYNLVGTNGLLYNYTDVIDTLTFRALITNNNFGMSAAIGLRRLTKWQKALEYPKV